MEKNTGKFITGLAKLEQNILKNMESERELGKAIPILEIPKELDPTFGMVLSEDLDKVYNCPNIFDILLTRVKVEADPENDKNRLSAIIKDTLIKKHFSDEVIDMMSKTMDVTDIILASELEKELSDAYYFIIKRFCDVTEEEYNIPGLGIDLFNALIDDTFSDSVAMYLIKSKVYRPKPDNYTAYQYEYLARQRIVSIVSATLYNRLREYLYKHNLTQDTEVYIKVYELNTFTYLYIFDATLAVLLNAFQHKIAYCYSQSMNFDKLLLEFTSKREIID